MFSFWLSNTNIERVDCPYFRNILVEIKSVVSGHSVMRRRERLADKFEFIQFDPMGMHAIIKYIDHNFC